MRSLQKGLTFEVLRNLVDNICGYISTYRKWQLLADGGLDMVTY